MKKFPIHSTEDLGEFVREERKRQNLTLKDLSASTGIGVRFISEFERGKKTSEINKALIILGALGILWLLSKK